ncbi:DUF4153 domain-containing protein [Conexibacter sp. SYSU D00693]|uniref:DUF4153 domain-containing protein n=1 Tax=Conexibacter sp. SYSU D00693 TaxID=2812560 RepID=UPI00196AEB25|nr:DUF4173 domain-containing protein [Conexibacter sp. SYSU D00693]
MPASPAAPIAAASVLAAALVAHQRVGLALTFVLLLLLAAAVKSVERTSWPLVGLGVLLACGPTVRDAGWVVALDVAGVVMCAGAVVVAPASWPAVLGAVFAPLRLVAAARLAGRELVPERASRPLGPLLRGGALAAGLLVVFGGLLLSADAAFADMARDALALDVDAGPVAARIALGVVVAAVGAALVATARRSATPVRLPPTPGVLELRIAVGALVTLFAVFVAVQLQVLFGGAGYVRDHTGLGLGEYARQGFVALLAAVTLTLSVVGVAARHRDPVVRGLLGALCLLCLVMLASAHVRLDAVVDAYGLTRVRVAGGAVVVWLAVVLLLVLAAGASKAVARWAPALAVGWTLTAVAGLSLLNPDARIVDRALETGDIDATYLATLSADAVPAARRLPGPAGPAVVATLKQRLDRGDGLAGFNVSRRRAR